jgi:hypothetical protein
MWMYFYSELKTWQQGLAALVGFIALISAAMWNFHLNRRRDAELRLDEVRAILAALYGEIIVLREQLARTARVISTYESNEQEITSEFVHDYSPPEPLVYPKLVERFGILPAEFLWPIVRFYADYVEAKNTLPMLVEHPEARVKYSSLGYLEPAERAVNDTSATLRKIEKMIGFAEAPTPTLGMTSRIIKKERVLFDTPPQGRS